MASANLENSALSFQPDRHLIAGRYRVHARIGHGRLGEIFSAVDASDDKHGAEPHLAIQTIPESVVRNNKLFNKINRGYTELRAAAHPNIVDFLDFGRDGRFGYLVMDLLDGLSLRSVLDKTEVLTPDEAKPIIRGVGEALQLLHAKDMLHGNLSTSNVFITHELEVRLLDVLPLDAAEPILRGTTGSEPFSRLTTEDDVFDLACLAYEMLAGKHPFEATPPAEARLAGREAQRIASLNDSEWSALHRALSVDREQRTSSIAEFMREFGVGDAERLWPTDEPAGLESNAFPTEAEAQPITRPAAPAQSAAPGATIDSMRWDEDWLQKAEPIRTRTRPLRTVFLGMLLAGLSAWFFYGQPRDNIADLTSYIDEYINVAPADQADEVVEKSTPDSAKSASTDDVALVDDPAANAAVATDDVALADEEATQPEPERAATNEENHSGSTEMNAAPAQADAESDVVQSIVTVSERDGVARIAPPAIENSSTPLIWWTNGHTANAGKDFISVEQQTVTATSAEDGTVLYVSLVNDNLPEPPESFFVSFGLRDPQQGHVERIATVRVDIVDDELR